MGFSGFDFAAMRELNIEPPFKPAEPPAGETVGSYLSNFSPGDSRRTRMRKPVHYSPMANAEEAWYTRLASADEDWDVDFAMQDEPNEPFAWEPTSPSSLAWGRSQTGEPTSPSSL